MSLPSHPLPQAETKQESTYAGEAPSGLPQSRLLASADPGPLPAPVPLVPAARARVFTLALQAGGAFLAVFFALLLGGWSGLPLLMAPFGASCVLAFALPDSPLAQPRSIIGGHALSTAIGLLLLHTAGFHPWSAALGVALAIFLMGVTRTLHPPAGADPLLVLLGGASWSFLWAPAVLGALWITAAAWAFHRASGRHYPQRWW
ncbi:HPP family protein [Paenibacillus mucilaginosus]|uniref:HPP family protein n=3 Tax=Paenibacillus mucilaginosus TaxID=61624 RepID=H6N976_9BACL|nr:HPP family protein [Paenibacillus mucilaginosus]AEI39573.1 HPP family protein [Paenibacillus mucilaginosus KNP414]AFC27822.1 HPP family protein [Paenibacillus mucilaginosus 3016]AFH59975.1 membrane protein [Paenibacillus mucilaginosus K02]MCG7214615.1 HPP family protein [Paenibacillus mucilaginosus]WDM28524.1 HPP family protein [Paenibacillus mucilaginosus]